MSKRKLPTDPADYYAHNNVSLEQLAELYDGTKGCSIANLKRRAATEKWQERRCQNQTRTILKTDEIIIQKKALEIVSFFERRNRIREIYLQEIETVGLEILTERQAKTLGLTVQDGEGFPNKFSLNTHQAGLNLALEMEKQDRKIEAVLAANPAPVGDTVEAQIMGYREILDKLSGMAGDDQIMFVATGKLPEDEEIKDD